MNALAPLESRQPPSLFGRYRSTLTQAAQQGVQASFAVLGYRGKNWRLKYRGEETLLKDSQSGQPFPTLDVIIVGVSNAISKIFYLGKYIEGSDDPPDCFSVDGITPDVTSPQPQCATCAVCPHNQWGSRMTEAGKKGKACQDSRRIAVVPAADPLNESFGGPMMLRIPPMSLNALAQYAQLLERKSAVFEFVITRLGFDYDVAYPKLTFSPVDWLSDQQAVMVVGPDGAGGVCKDPLLERMLSDADVTVAVPATQPDPLANGGPAAVFTQPQQNGSANGSANGHAQPETQPQPTPAAKPRRAAPAPEPAPAPAPAPTPAPANPFAAAAIAAGPSVAPTATAASVADTSAVQDSPADLQAAIDALLSS